MLTSPTNTCPVIGEKILPPSVATSGRSRKSRSVTSVLSAILFPLCSLRILLALFIVVLVAFVGGSTILTSYLTFLKGLGHVTKQYQYTLNRDVETFVTNHVNEKLRTLREVTTALTFHYNDLDTFFQLPNLTRAQFLSGFTKYEKDFDGIIQGGIMIGSRMGNFTMSQGDAYYITRGDPVHLLFGSFHQCPLPSINITSDIGLYNVTGRPWYLDASQRSEELYPTGFGNTTAPKHCTHEQWDEFSFSIYVSIDVVPTAEMSISVALFDTENQFQGVVAYVMNLPLISKYLQHLQSTKEQVFILFDRKGRVFASSQSDSVVSPDGQRVQVENYSDPTLRQIARDMRLLYGENYALLNAKNGFESFSSASYLVSVSCLVLSRDLDFIVLVALPSDVVYSQVHLMAILSLAIIVFILFISSVVALTCSYVAMRPLYSITRAMKKAQNLEIESIRPLKAGLLLYEYHFITKAFDSLVSKLEEYRSFLPDYVVRSDSEPEKKFHGVPNHDEGTVGKSPIRIETGVITGDEATSEDEDAAVQRACTSVLGNKTPASPHSSARGGFGFETSSPEQKSKFERGLSMSRLGVLFMRIHNASRLVVHSEQYMSQYQRVIDLVSNAASSNGGFIQSMNQDRICVIFSQKNIPVRLARIVKVAFHISHKMKEINSSTTSDNPPIRFSISLSHGVCQHGVIGSHRNRVYSVFGTPRDDCWLSCLAADRLHAQIVCDEELFNYIDSQNDKCQDQKIICTPVDVVLSSIGKRLVVYEIVHKYHLHDAEWLYALQFKQAAKAHSKLKEAFDCLMKNQVQEAEQLYNEIDELNVKEVNTARFTSICRTWSQKKHPSDFSITEWMAHSTRNAPSMTHTRSILAKDDPMGGFQTLLHIQDI